jgi:hypothetical protein
MDKLKVAGLLVVVSLLPGACGGGDPVDPPSLPPSLATTGAGVTGSNGIIGAITGAAGSGGAGTEAATGAAAGTTGAAGAGTTPGALAVRWTFPALVTSDKARGAVFPTYLAHLLGKPIKHPFPTSLVCADVTNPGPAAPATLTVKFAIYGQDAVQDVTLGAGATRACLTPVFDLAKLYALRDATVGRIEASLAVGGAPASSTMQEVSIAPVNDIAWAQGAISPADMQDLASVFVTPKDPKIDQLQRLAAETSPFGGFGGGDPYARAPYLREVELQPGEYSQETTFLEAGEALGWALPAISGGDGTVEVALFTIDQFDAWVNGSSDKATRAWTSQGAGAKDTVTGLPAGVYRLAFFNADAGAARRLQWVRNATREDVAVDVLASIYDALKQLNTRYSNITDSYFQTFQHIRRPSEVLAALSANCLDGSLVFASALELLGMEPVVIAATGHAFVGVKSAPASSVIWAIETTLVGTNPVDDALGVGMQELIDDARSDPRYHVIDIKALRARGVLPLPQ